MILRLLLLCSFTTQLSAYGNCPYRCECIPHHSLPSSWQVSCQWDSLPESSPFAVSSSIISLSIHCPSPSPRPLSSTLFKGLSGLNKLTIQGCAIATVEENSFEGMTNLRELFLFQISPANASFSLSPSLLTPLNRLLTLHLSDSNLPSLPPSTFCTLPNLQMLNVSGNSLIDISPSTTSPPCIASNLLIADFSRNRIPQLLEKSLRSYPAVRQLVIEGNTLDSIHEQAFNSTLFLQQLDLKSNRIRHIGFLPDTVVSLDLSSNLFESLPLSVASLPNLVHLNVSSNILSSPLPPLSSIDLETVDLSFNRLSSLPTMSNSSWSSLSHLHIHHNLLSSLPSFTAPLLSTLDVSMNKLTSVEDGVLSSLPSLSLLQLSHNSLSLLTPSSLIGLQLDTLDLSHNRISTVPSALSSLASLRTLSLSHNSISSISHSVISSVEGLTSLDLSGNVIEKLSPHDISGSKSLTWLSLSHNHLREVSPTSFSHCDSLRQLDLSSNRLPSLSLSQLLNSLRFLNMSSNLLTSLDWEGIPTKIDTLLLDSNRVSMLKGNPTHHRIRQLSLSRNVLSSLSSSLLPDSLEFLNVSSNIISSIAPSTFSSKATFNTLDISHNSLTSLSFSSVHVPAVPSAVAIHLSNNPLSCSCDLDWVKDGEKRSEVRVVDMDVAECTSVVNGKRHSLEEIDRHQLMCNYTKMCAPGCICCQFSSCDCKSECPRGCSCWTDSSHSVNLVKCIALRGSDAQRFSIRDLPMSSTHIVLSGFPLTVLKEHSFLGRSKLHHLHINNTQLRIIEPMAFNKASALQLLDLSFNELEAFHSSSLYRTSNITHLFLDHNKIDRVDEELLKKLPHLEAMTLNHNNLEDVPSSLSSLHSLTLSSNPFRCDCDPFRFHTPSLLSNFSHKIQDASRVLCVENVTRAFRLNDTTILSAFPPNVKDDIYQMSMLDFVNEMNTSICVEVARGVFGREPSSSILFILVVVFILFLIFGCIVITFAIARRRTSSQRKRYKLNSSSLSSSSPGSSPLPLPLIGYDIFISCSQKDEKLVNEKILRALEADYQVALLHRDTPKIEISRHAISDELTQIMKSSTAIIMVITRNFLENEWNSMQVKFSHQLVAKDKSQFLAIFGDDVDMNCLDTELGQIVRKKTRVRLCDHLYYNTLNNFLPIPSRLPLSDNPSHIYSDCDMNQLQPGVIVPSAIV